MSEVHSTSIERTYYNGDTAKKRVTLVGKTPIVGEVLSKNHFYAGWTVTATVLCGHIN